MLCEHECVFARTLHREYEHIHIRVCEPFSSLLKLAGSLVYLVYLFGKRVAPTNSAAENSILM